MKMKHLSIGLTALLLCAANSMALQSVRVVRITQNKTTLANPLQLAEVRVFEEGTGTNVALGGTASQSSQLNAFGPGLAIDGALNNFQHTLDQAGGGQTWEVDLLGDFEISGVEIFARHNCCGQNRTADIQLQIFDASGAELFNERVTGITQNGQSRLITTPNIIPEPATATLALFGAAGLLRRRRRIA